jgi:peptidoglycan/xylan/chitin deacetylase (PgdA/CDA1 family)
MDKKFALLSNDVETTSIWFNDLRDKTGELVLREGMPRLLDLYSRYMIRSTFFFTGYIANLYPEVVRLAVDAGHEVGSHGKTHVKENGFDAMPYNKQVRHLDYSRKLLQDISGQDVISFRAPALRVSALTSSALIETGFRIDSSIASQRFDFFLSFGSKQKLCFLTSPRLPYRVNKNNIFKKGQSCLVEIPLSASLIPFAGTTMRIFPKTTLIQQRFLHLESLANSKPIVFVTHPNEFIDESSSVRTIKRRSHNPISYLLSDVLRARLKAKNLGTQAIPLYEKLIRFYVDKGYNFSTMRDYARYRFPDMEFS